MHGGHMHEGPERDGGVSEELRAERRARDMSDCIALYVVDTTSAT